MSSNPDLHVCIVCPHGTEPFDGVGAVKTHIRYSHQQLLNKIDHDIDQLHRPYDPVLGRGTRILNFLKTLDSLRGVDDFIAECEIHDGRDASR